MLGHFKKRDIAGGDFLYGERIMLARIFQQKDIDDLERTKQIIEALHGFKPSNVVAAHLLPYALDICKAFLAWTEREEQECSVPPLPQATQAGVEQLTKEVGDMGNVVALAERFGFTFEQVYKMPYMDVFTIWKVDAAMAKYNRRLKKVLEAESKG